MPPDAGGSPSPTTTRETAAPSSTGRSTSITGLDRAAFRGARRSRGGALVGLRTLPSSGRTKCPESLTLPDPRATLTRDAVSTMPAREPGRRRLLRGVRRPAGSRLPRLRRGEPADREVLPEVRGGAGAGPPGRDERGAVC